MPLIVASAFLMEQIDNASVATAIPAIASDMGVEPARLSVLISAYVLALVLFMPVSGWLAERIGTRRVFCGAILIFLTASLACSFAQDVHTMVLLRAVQGMGGALMTPVGRLILLRSFRPHELVAAMSLMTAPVLIGPLIGPLLSGLVTAHASWRWIFAFNLPVAALGFVLAYRYVPDHKGEQSKPFDLRGLLLVAPTLLIIQLAIEVVAADRGNALILGSMGATILLLAGLYLLHSRRTRNPLLDLSLFRIRSFRTGSLIGGITRTGLNAVPFLLPMQLQLALGHSSAVAGGLLALAVCGAFVVKPLNGRLLRRMGFRWLLVISASLQAVIIGTFGLYDVDTPLWLIAGHIVAFGVARTLLFNTFNILAYCELPSSHQSQGVGLGGLVQQLSMGFGVSLSAMLLSLLGGDDLIARDEFAIVYALAAAVTLLSALGFARLRSEDGLVAIVVK